MSPTIDQARWLLGQLVLDNPELERLESELAKFNVFDVLGATKVELRHSNALAWLLDPNQNHGLGSWFLREFLKRSVAPYGTRVPGISVLDLDVFDYGDVEVRREWENIDVLVILHDVSPPVVVAIENKIGAGEHGDQLERYHRTVARHFPGTTQLLLLLTPDGRDPVSDDQWLPVEWDVVVQLLNRVLQRDTMNLSNHTHSFLAQYQEILRRHVVGEHEIAELCRKIYTKHRVAIDMIFEYRPDLTVEIQQYMEKQIAKKSPELIADHSSKTAIRFTHRDLEKLVTCRGSGWTFSGRVLLFEIHNYEKVSIRLYIGPGTNSDRQRLLDCCLRDTKLFPLAQKSFGVKWHSVRQSEMLSKKDLDGVSSIEDVEARLEARFEHYVKDDLPQIVAHFAKFWNATTESP